MMSYFLEWMGMQSLEDLPELAPYLPEMDDMEEELAAQQQTPTPTARAHNPGRRRISGRPDAKGRDVRDVGKPPTAEVDEKPRMEKKRVTGDLDTENTEGELEPGEKELRKPGR